MTSLPLGAPPPGDRGSRTAISSSTTRRSTTPLLKSIMKYTTLRVGHFEINYGDAHFRRSDNGNSMYNPFVGNYILDAFTTEIGAEAYAALERLDRDGRRDGRRSARPGDGARRSARPSVPRQARLRQAGRRRPPRPPHRLVLREQHSRRATRCSPATAAARATTTCSRTPRRPRRRTRGRARSAPGSRTR